MAAMTTIAAASAGPRQPRSELPRTLSGSEGVLGTGG